MPRLPLAYITEGNPGVCHRRIRPLLKPGIRVLLQMTTASLMARKARPENAPAAAARREGEKADEHQIEDRYCNES